MIGPEEKRLEKTFIPAVRQDIQAHLVWFAKSFFLLSPLPPPGGEG
jgi:hypothetical protein